MIENKNTSKKVCDAAYKVQSGIYRFKGFKPIKNKGLSDFGFHYDTMKRKAN